MSSVFSLATLKNCESLLSDVCFVISDIVIGYKCWMWSLKHSIKFNAQGQLALLIYRIAQYLTPV